MSDGERPCEGDEKGGLEQQEWEPRGQERACPGNWVEREFGVGSGPQSYIFLERLNRMMTGKKLLDVTKNRPLWIFRVFSGE